LAPSATQDVEEAGPPRSRGAGQRPRGAGQRGAQSGPRSWASPSPPMTTSPSIFNLDERARQPPRAASRQASPPGRRPGDSDVRLVMDSDLDFPARRTRHGPDQPRTPVQTQRKSKVQPPTTSGRAPGEAQRQATWPSSPPTNDSAVKPRPNQEPLPTSGHPAWKSPATRRKKARTRRRHRGTHRPRTPE